MIAGLSPSRIPAFPALCTKVRASSRSVAFTTLGHAQRVVSLGCLLRLHDGHLGFCIGKKHDALLATGPELSRIPSPAALVEVLPFPAGLPSILSPPHTRYIAKEADLRLSTLPGPPFGGAFDGFGDGVLTGRNEAPTIDRGKHETRKRRPRK